MSFFAVHGQSQITIEKKLLNDLVRTAEKLKADNTDMAIIDKNQKLIIESQGIRIIELEDTITLMEEQILKVKTAYNDIISKNQKNRFWLWLKNTLAGMGIGGAVVFVLLL